MSGEILSYPPDANNLMEYDWLYRDRVFPTRLGVVYAIHHPHIGKVIGSLSWDGEIVSASDPEARLTWCAGIGQVKL